MSQADTYNKPTSHFGDDAVVQLDKVDWSELYNDPRYNGLGEFVLSTHSIVFPELRISEENPDLALKTRTHVQVNEPIYLVNKYPGVIFLAGDRIQDAHEIVPAGHFVLVRNHRFKNIYFIRRRGDVHYSDVERAAFRFLNGESGESGASIGARNCQWWSWFRDGTLEEDIVSVNIGCPIGHIVQDGEGFKVTTARHSEYTYTLILQRDAYPSIVPQYVEPVEDPSYDDRENYKVKHHGIPDYEFAQDVFAGSDMDPRSVSVAEKVTTNKQPYTNLTREVDYRCTLQQQRQDIVNERFVNSGQASDDHDDSSYGSSPSSSATSRRPKGLIKRTRDGQHIVKWTTEDFKPVVINVIPESRKVHEKNLRCIFAYLAVMHVTGEEISDATAPYSSSDESDSDSESEDEDGRKTPTMSKRFFTTPPKFNGSGAAAPRHGYLADAPRNQKNYAPTVNSATPEKLVAPGVKIAIQTPTPRSAKMYGYPISYASSSSSESESDCLSSPTPSSSSAATSPGQLAPRHRDRRTNELFKTELCKNYTELRMCKYGESCQFAHGPEELREVKHHNSWRTKTCAAWLQGGCTYGSRCCYAHERKGDMGQPFECNPKLEDRQLLRETPSGLENLDLSDLRLQPSSKIFAAALENDNFTPFMMNLKIEDDGDHEDTPDNVIPSSQTTSRFKSPDDAFGSMSGIPPLGPRRHYPSRFFD